MNNKLTTFLAGIFCVVSAQQLNAEFQVNTRTSLDETSAAIAADGGGNFLVVWSSYYSYGGKSTKIRGRRFSANGSPIDANEFEVNTTWTGNQKEPDVAMDAEGNFVVVWQSHDVNNINNIDIYGQLFDNNGLTLGEQFQVNDDVNSRAINPKVAMNSSGEFVVVWEQVRYWPYYGDRSHVAARIFASNAAAAGTSFEVYILSGSHNPDVGIRTNGEFTIVWMQDDNEYQGSNVIWAKQYYANGAFKTDAMQVSATEFWTVTKPTIAMNSSGHFVVAWDAGASTSTDDIYARRYKFDGTAVTDEFMVNSTTSGIQTEPATAINIYREFIIVWNSETSTNTKDLFGQRYDGFNRPIGDEFRLNEYIADDQKEPDVSLGSNGCFAACWQSFGQDGLGVRYLRRNRTESRLG